MSVQVPVPAWRSALAVLVAAEVALVALHLVGLAVDSTLLKLSSEDNIPTWFASAQFLLAGVACWAASFDAGRTRLAWITLALVMTAFSADEIARFHERLETRQGTEIAIYVIEPILAVAVAALFWSVRRHLERAGAGLLAAAMGAIVISQALASAIEKFDPSGAAREVLAVPAEVLELLTGALVLTAALAYLDRRQSSKNA